MLCLSDRIQRVGGSTAISAPGATVPLSPRCQNGHEMTVSDWLGLQYASGWKCDQCNIIGMTERWLCRICTTDYCLSCYGRDGTNLRAATIPGQCSNGHTMSLSQHLKNCSQCKVKDPNQLYLCEVCNEYLCLKYVLLCPMFLF